MAIENKFISLYVNGFPARAQSQNTEILFQGIGVGEIASGLFITESAGNHFDFNAKRLENLADPTADQHAATKKYVDDEIASLNISGTAWSLGGNALTQAEKLGSTNDFNVSIVREDVDYIILDKDGSDLGVVFAVNTFHAAGATANFLNSTGDLGGSIGSVQTGRLSLNAPDRFRFTTDGMSGANIEVRGIGGSAGIRAGYSTNFNGRNLTIQAGGVEADDDSTYTSGNLILESGTVDESAGDLLVAYSGSVNLRSANANDLITESGSGDVNISTGTSGASNPTGDINIFTGTTVGGDRGDINLAANEIISSARVRPSANEGQDLGSTSFRWGEVYASTVNAARFGTRTPNDVLFMRDDIDYIQLSEPGGVPTVIFGSDVDVVNINSAKLTNLIAPVDPSDAATKEYVDALAAGLQPKRSVFVATTAPIADVTYDNGTGTLTANDNGIMPDIEGASMFDGAEILVKNQANAVHNGIYVVTDVGSAGTPFILTRRNDLDGTPASEVSGGSFVFVESGTVNENSGWVLQGQGVLSLGTTPLIWVKFSTQGQITAGAGLTRTVNDLSVNTGDGIYIDVSDQVAVDYRKSYSNNSLNTMAIREVVALNPISPTDVIRVNATNVDPNTELVVAFAAVADGNSGLFYTREGAVIPGFSGLEVGGNVYLARTGNGALTQDIGSFEAGDKVWIVGKAVSETEVKYKPQYLYEIL